MTRRFGIALTLLTSAALGTGLAATPAGADTGPCQQPAPICSAYDTAKAEATAALAQAVADCAATFAGSPCPELAAVVALVESWAFFPYDVCVTNNGTTTCIGPIE